MMKSKFLAAAGLVSALGLGLGANAAFALPYLSPTGNLLTTTPLVTVEDNYVQLLEDEFYEVLIRDGSVLAITPDTVIQTGDLFAGVQRIQNTELAAPEGGPGPGEPINLQGDTATFTSIFLLEALTVTIGTAGVADSAQDILTFGFAGVSAWETIYGSGGLLDISSAFNISDLDSSTAGNQQVSTGTLAMLFYGVKFSDSTSTGTLSDSATSFVNGGTLQYEFGFTGTDGAAQGPEFWKTQDTNAANPYYSATYKPDTTLALNITKQWEGPDLEKHYYRQSQGDLNFTGPTHIQGVGEVSGTASGTSWGVRGDLDEYIRPIPEPTSITLLSLGLLGIGLGGRRMKKAA